MLRSLKSHYLRLDPARKRFWLLAVITLSCGLTSFFTPLDDVLRSVRTNMLLHPADGQTVVVKIDEASVRELGGRWPWSRNVDADIVDSLRLYGARRVFFDRAMVDRNSDSEDLAFLTATRKMAGRMFLGGQYSVDDSGIEASLLPNKDFRRELPIRSFNIWRNSLGQTDKVPLSHVIDGKIYPSISAEMAGVHGNAWFRPNFSIDISTIVTVSASDLVLGRVRPGTFANKDVVVGLGSQSLGDNHWFPGQGMRPGVFVHALAAETLRGGLPRDSGWLPVWICSVLACFALQFMARNTMLYTAGVVTLIIYCGAAFYGDMHNVTLEIVPGSILFFAVLWKHLSVFELSVSKNTNAVSGLPNLSALKAVIDVSSSTIIALKVTNFRSIGALGGESLEQEVVSEIRRRLCLGDIGLVKIYQGDEGTFFFLINSLSVDDFSGHLDGLFSIISMPIVSSVGPIDLVVGIGFDKSVAEPTVKRIGNAVTAAEAALAGGKKFAEASNHGVTDEAWDLSLMGQLDEAMLNGDLWVSYQPQLDLKSGRISGAEALVRWSHPTRGEIKPDQFIPIVESHNRLANLTDFVLGEAIRRLKEIRFIEPNFTVSVNVSATALEDKSFPENVDALLTLHMLDPSALIIEVTETSEICNMSDVLCSLNALRSLGVGVSIDDYGTGQSTLAYLRVFPATEIKIDRSFVGTVGLSSDDREIIKSTVLLAHALGLQVVAEGVESIETLSYLHNVGCDVAQGYWISKPMHFLAMKEFVRSYYVELAA